MNFDRETIASAIVGTAGAWLVGLAAVHARTGRWNATQRRWLYVTGVGFLMSAIATRWLQPFNNRGIAVSILGTVLAMRGMYGLVRARIARRNADNAHAPE